MEQANNKAYELIALINSKTEYVITKEMYSTGSFPWNETNESKGVNLFIIKFKLVYTFAIADMLFFQLT